MDLDWRRIGCLSNGGARRARASKEEGALSSLSMEVWIVLLFRVDDRSRGGEGIRALARVIRGASWCTFVYKLN